MKAPEKIFLSVEKGQDWTHAMWTQKDPKEQKFSELDEHEEYIHKDALLEYLNGLDTNSNYERFVIGNLIEHIESL